MIIGFITPIGRKQPSAIALRDSRSKARRFVRTGNTYQASETMRQTEITVEAPFALRLFGPAIQSGHSGGVDTLRILTKSIHSARWRLMRLGYSLHPTDGVPSRLAEGRFRMPVDDSMTREMIAVLDLPGDAPFNDQQMAVSSLGSSTRAMCGSGRPIHCRAATIRARSTGSPANLFLSNLCQQTGSGRSLLPDVLDMIEIDGIGRDYTPARERPTD